MTAIRLFDSPHHSVVQNNGRELSIIDARTEETIGTVEIQPSCPLSSHVVSMSSTSARNRLAYMLDNKTIAVKDLVSGGKSTISHTEPVDFLEINCEGNCVLFRDGQKALHLYSLDSSQSTVTLLKSGCRYAQWVPDSNAIVAQSMGRSIVHVWYNPLQPHHSVTHAISGTVTSIVRSKDGKADVHIQNGATQSTLPLQKDLIDLWSTSSTSIPQNQSGKTKAALYQWLLDTRQLEKAADIKEKEGNFVASAKLLADAGLPLMASQLVAEYNITEPRGMLERIARALEKDGAYEKASNLFLRIDESTEAMRVLSIEPSVKSVSDAGEDQLVLSPENDKESLHAKELPPKELTVESLLASGQYETALDIFSSKDEWDALWEAASSHDDIDPDLLSQYAATRARQLLNDDNDSTNNEDKNTKERRQNGINEALDLLIQYCPDPNHQDHGDLFNDLGGRILRRSKQEDGNSPDTLLPRLKSLLFAAATKYETDTSPDFTEMLHATHYLSMMQLCSEHELHDLGTKCAVTLLRYSGVIPTDKAFYLAGILCKDKGHTNLAFVLLNRYVDLVEAVEGESMVDSDDFADAGIIPSITNAPIPTTHYVTCEDDREEVRDWVLSTCMDSSIEKELPSSESIDGTMYAGLFQSDNPQCIVTGYPVSQSDQKVLNDGCIANGRDWNTFVSKVRKNPWTGEDARPSL